MNAAFALHYAFALLVVALTLLGLHAATKFVTGRAGRGGASNRILSVIESRPLTASSHLHVVRVRDREIVLASTRDAIVYLGTLEARSTGTGPTC